MLSFDALDRSIDELNQETSKRILKLSFKGQSLDNNDILSLTSKLDALEKLDELYLDLEDNHIGFLGAKALIDFLQSREYIFSVLEINLRANVVNDKGARLWCEYLTSNKCPNKMVLSLAFNNIRRDGAKLIAKTITSDKCCQYLTLDLRQNNILLGGKKALREAQSSGNVSKDLILLSEGLDNQLEYYSNPRVCKNIFFEQHPGSPDADTSDYIRGVWPVPVQ